MTTAEILTGLRPVTKECFEVFAPYYEERAKHYVYPRYMQSVCVLLDMGKTYYNIIRANHGKVLVVYKRTQIFGKTGVQMPICPISLTGSMQDELSVMLAALKVGISLRVTNEDIARYRIPRNICSDGTGPFVPVNNEYLYQAQHGQAMCGSKYRKLRNLTKRITQASGYTLMTGAHPQIENIVRDWARRYKEAYNESADQTNLWHVCKAAPEAYVTTRSIVIGETLQCFSVLERLAPKQYIIVQRVRNYHSRQNDVGAAMQWADCNAVITEGATAPVYLNMGLADTDGLIHAKEALQPCAHQKIYTVKTNKTSDKLKAYFK